MRDDALIERTLRHTNASAGVRHCASGQAKLLQKFKARSARLIFAHARIVEHAQQRLRCCCKARRA